MLKIRMLCHAEEAFLVTRVSGFLFLSTLFSLNTEPDVQDVTDRYYETTEILLDSRRESNQDRGSFCRHVKRF